MVLTHEGWSRLFDRDPMVIGRPLDVNGVPLVVVGVMAPEFSGMDEVRDAWVPITMYRPLLGENPFAADARRVQVTVRLRHDVASRRPGRRSRSSRSKRGWPGGGIRSAPSWCRARRRWR